MKPSAYSTAQNARFCLRHTALCYPPLLWWCAAAALAGALLPILTAYLPKIVVAALTEKARLARLAANTLAFALCVAAAAFARQLAEKYVYRHKFKMSTYFLRRVCEKGLSTDYVNLENERFRKLQSESVVCCDGHYAPLLQLYDALVALATGLVGVCVYGALLARLSPLLAVCLLLTTFAGYGANAYLVKWATEHSPERMGYDQKIRYLNAAASDARAGKDVRLYRMAAWFDRLYKINLEGLSDWYARYAARLFRVSAADGGLTLLREGAAYAFLIYLALSDKIGAADFLLYLGVTSGFSAWLSGSLAQINALKRINISLNALRAYLEYPEAYRRSGGRRAEGLQTLELRAAQYRYPGAETDTLRGIDLVIRPGEHIAVVGLNGAGKTTLVKLLCGLTDPTGGETLYGGENVQAYDRDSYYGLFAAVFQQHSLLPVTVAEIVSAARAEETDEERVRACLAKAGLLAKIDSLPKGIYSMYGRGVYDDGVELSGGETQKLLFARALYKDAPILVLDEPTAALDPISESRLYETYDEIARGKTVVFISHRLASTRFCDRILLMQGGGIVESGTHAELLQKGGAYAALFETQARYYRAEGGAEA